MLEIPFYPCEKRRCAQAAMKSALKAIMPERDFSFEELDELTKHSTRCMTSLPQVAMGFMKLEVNFRYYAKPGWANAVLANDFTGLIRKRFRELSEVILARTDLDSLKYSLNYIAKDPRVIEREEDITLEDIENMVTKNEIPICIVNYDIISGNRSQFGGHSLIITGFENDQVIYHDSGPVNPAPNKRVSREVLEGARDLCFFDHGLIVVSRLLKVKG